jgi:transposase
MQDLLQFPIWLEERAVAERLKVSVYTIQRMRKRGDQKAKRIGNRWRYRSDWLRE